MENFPLVYTSDNNIFHPKRNLFCNINSPCRHIKVDYLTKPRLTNYFNPFGKKLTLSYEKKLSCILKTLNISMQRILG